MDQNNTTPNKGAKGNAPQSPRRRQPKAGASVQMQVQDHIGRQLRAVYDDLLSQPVPDRFLELLDQLDKGQTADLEVPPPDESRAKSTKGSS
jgi:hypothetical protein